MNNENNYKKYIAKKIRNKNSINTYNLLSIKKRVVVKISKRKELLENDNNTSKKLEELKCVNFAKYFRFFSCKNNNIPNYVLFMEYYNFGSILNYIPKSLNEIISILNQVIASATLAFEHFGFIHGYLHPGNILIKKTKNDFIKYKFTDKELEIKTNGIQIVINDFDKSNFNGNFAMFFLNLSLFIDFYEMYFIEKNLFNKNTILVTPFAQLKKEFYKIINITQLKEFIGN
jgi:serine/threonine protein kinase